METYCRYMSDCFNKSYWSFIQAANGDFMEETCDSDSCFKSENSYSHSGRVNKSGQFQLFIADDVQSTTSDSNWVDDWSEESEEEVGDHADQTVGLMSYMNYLQNASDDDLGLPSNLKEDQTQQQFCGDGDPVQAMVLDLDFDVDLSEGKTENREDDSLFWLSLLRG